MHKKWVYVLFFIKKEKDEFTVPFIFFHTRSHLNIYTFFSAFSLTHTPALSETTRRRCSRSLYPSLSHHQSCSRRLITTMDADNASKNANPDDTHMEMEAGDSQVLSPYSPLIHFYFTNSNKI